MNDQSPALEVNLTTTNPASSSPNEILTEVNLNDQENTRSAQTQVEVNLTPVSPSPQQDSNLPPLSELPSYTEALRIKNLEAHSNELPPGYFSSPSNDTRFPIVENVDVSFLILFFNFLKIM